MNRSCVPDYQLYYTASYVFQGIYGFASIFVYIINVIALHKMKNTLHRTFIRLYLASALWSSIYFLFHFCIRRFLRAGFFCEYLYSILWQKTFILHPYRIVTTYSPIMILFIHFLISVHRLTSVRDPFKSKLFWEKNAAKIRCFGLLIPFPFMWFVFPYKGYVVVSPSGGLGIEYEHMQSIIGDLSATLFAAIAAIIFGILTVVNTFVTFGHIKAKKVKVDTGIMLFESFLALFTLVYAATQVVLYATMHTETFKSAKVQEIVEEVRYYVIDLFILPHAWTLLLLNSGVRREARKLFRRNNVVLPVSASSDKTVAEPVDDTVFKKVNCPIWTEKVEVNYTELLPLGTYISHRFLLRPQVPFTFRSTTITVDFVTVPPLLLLGNEFLVSTSATAPIVVRVPQDAPIALRCPSEEDARAMNSSNCQLLDTCHCSRSETENRCQCDSVNITSLSESLDFRLLISSSAARLPNEDHYIYAETFSSVAEVSLEYTGHMEALLVQSDKCLATAKPFEGCFSCRHGAQAELTCRSEKATIGTLLCGDRTFALSCAPAGSPTILDKAKFEERCNLTCGSGSQEILLHGLLTFHPEWDLHPESSGAPTPTFLIFFNVPDLSHIGSFLESWWWTSVACLIVVVAAVTTTIVVAPRILPCIFPAAKIAGKLL